MGVLAWVMARIPLSVADPLAWCVAWVWWFILPIRRRLAADNLRRAFPAFDAPQVRRTLVRMMHDIVLSYIELVVFDRTGQASPAIGAELVPPGSLLIGAHSGAWDLGLLVAARAVPLATFVRTPSGRWAREKMASLRAKHGLLFLETGSTLADGYAALEAGRSLLLIQDQRLNKGIPSRVFGRPCKTSPALGVMWLKTQRPVFAVWQRRVGPGQHRFECQPFQMPEPTGDKEADVQAITDACNAYYEARIREEPSGWLWLHDRWR